MMSAGVFYLDEDGDGNSSDSPSPRSSPPLIGDTPRSSPAPSTSSNTSTLPTLQIPLVGQPPLLSPQPLPFGQPVPQHRKHITPFQATPSFPSPLAQAIIPIHSDTSSSSSHSSNGSDDEGHQQGIPSPVQSASSGTPKRVQEQFSRPRTASPHANRAVSPASTEKSNSRPPSPVKPQILTPGALLMRPKRSSTASASLPAAVAAPLRESPPRSVSPVRKVSPSPSGSRRFDHGARLDSPASASSSARRRGSSGSNASLNVPVASGSQSVSSPLAFGSPELEPALDDSPQRSQASGPPTRSQREGNVLGLGWGSGWESSSASGSSPGGSRDKGRGKDVIGPPSPRRERERTMPAGVSSPPRQRRPSEFLNPSSLDTRKMPIMGAGRNSLGGGSVASLSTSASMISPLNPLPSPWASSSQSSAFSPPSGQPSELSSATSTSSGGHAIRLNRVPTSVRLAAELIKHPTGPATDTPPSGGSTASTASVPTPNPSPAGSVPITSNMPPPASKSLGAFASMPPSTARPSAPAPSPTDLGIGRPSLSVPGTPMMNRDIRPTDKGSIGIPSLGRTEASRKGSSGSLAPPAAFKAPLPPVQARPRSGVPTEVPSLAPPYGNASPSASRRHRYRVSMHEAGFRPTLASEFSESPPQILSPPEESDALPSSGRSKAAAFGLGLQLPSIPVHMASSSASGSMTPGAPANQPRMRSTTGQGLQMDLAGISSLGDAASHASMIMQSRQAKLQRWRPSSAGYQSYGGADAPVPPAFSRSTTAGSPAMLVEPRVERQAQWGLQAQPLTAASSPGEDMPPFPLFRDRKRFQTLPEDVPLDHITGVMQGEMPPPPAGGLSRFGPIRNADMGGVGMEKQASASGTIAGIEWVDWYDCYKRYKDAKIRAERETAQATANPYERTPQPSTSVSPQLANDQNLSPREIDLGSNHDTTGSINSTMSPSPDDDGGQRGVRKRSLSIRSNLSSIDPKRSPSQKRVSVFDRPRQSSSSSSRSAEMSSSAAGIKKKKNLVNKMEGWWNAVKSNFIPEGQHHSHRPSYLGPDGPQRIPSSPQGRRGSDMSPIATPQAALFAPQSVRRNSTHSLRQATSHSELRSQGKQYDTHTLREAASIAGSTSADLPRISRGSSVEMDAPFPRPPVLAPPPERESGSRPEGSGLEARRGHPSLRLQLDSNVMTRAASRRTVSSDERGSHHSAPVANAERSTSSTSRSTSFGQPSAGPGLTPGVPKWDQTPSPIFALGSESRAIKEDQPVAPGTDITVASVRRHVRHRLNAAKATCDQTLNKAVAAITKFAEEQDVPELDDLPQDYFDAMSDSPMMESMETDSEAGDRVDQGMRSRAVSSSSRPHSRRASVSRSSNPTNTSPTKRSTMLPASPSRVRRRPSAVPRNYVGRDRVARNMSLSLDQPQSASSSRSTSRSRSPMPPHRALLSPGNLDFDPSQDDRNFLAALQDLIVLATDVLDLSVSSLVARPVSCPEIIAKIQKVGQKWDEHDDWPGRDWYVDILMAVANLKRVLDWWEAEKGFWNFDEEDENEPLLFVMKPHREESRFDDQFKAALANDRFSPLANTARTMNEPHSAVSLETLSPNNLSGEYTARTAVGPVAGTPKPQATEDLRFLAEYAKSVNIVMELSLQGEEILYVNDAIMEVIGRDPEDVLYKPITDLLAPADASVFAEATHTLKADDNNTVQLRFRFEVHELEEDETLDRQPGPIYIELEGVGMLMRESNEASHTMWVLKPVTAAQVDSATDAAFPHNGVISTQNILCRICEREILTWFFEKHNETCDAVHRLEAEILTVTECLHDLHHVACKLEADIQDADQQHPGVLFYTVPESLTGGHESSSPSGDQGIEIKRISLEDVRDAIEVLDAAEHIETPSVRDDEADLPFNVQKYLPRESEERLLRITHWQKPQTCDRALALLFAHIEEQVRRKQKAIARMQSTVRYSEKTRHDWEDKVNQMLAERDDGSPSESGSDGAEGAASPAETPTEAPDTSPPGYRKIAPGARLPITQGHPQRPSTGHGEQSFTTAPATPVAIPTPVITAAAPPSPPATMPPSLSAPLPTVPMAIRQSTRAMSKPPSPLLVPTERMGHARHGSMSRAYRDAPLSPRIPSAALQPRTAQPSIKDFEIIKPISRGAFGSVYLAKKVATGDYFAIKALKKSDMIAKNQITNVKAERTILMNQASSPYVAKLFFSFQSKDYLYLVMEYLNGGDCASLVKTLGGLSQDWARNYIAEVVLGLEYLHTRNIVHRDIKPDNLLIDARGHLKLTDFGLSRIGLLNRQVGGPRPAYLRGTSLLGSTRQTRPGNQRVDSGSSADSPIVSPELFPPPPMSNLSQSYFGQVVEGVSADESSGSESASMIPKHLRQMPIATKLSSEANTPSVTGREPPRFVGTPDYLAPESILGIGTDDKAVDWWALGVVLYEFLYGIPPFHAESPEKVFDNVISRRIDWHDDEIEISAEARDLMDRLMCSDANQRLGARGAEEVKKHAFFVGIDWDTITTTEASFVPEVTDPESTDYFDSRGAIYGFQDEEAGPQILRQAEPRLAEPVSPISGAGMKEVINDITTHDDFGAFNFKNLPVLKQANDDVIRKLRVDSMAPTGQTLDSTPAMRIQPRSLSAKMRKARRKPSDLAPAALPSPSTSTSSAASTPSRASVPPSTPNAVPALPQHFRRPSELNALDRVKSSEDADIIRRASAPTRVRAGSGSSVSDRSTSMELWRQRRQASLNTDSQALASGGSLESPERRSSMPDRTLDVLIAEDNPISQKILETLLTRMGCRCICVEDGSQALAATMGSIRFDVIICDIHMPVVTGEQVARMIRSTNNHNQHTPIIAATSYEQHRSITEKGTLFSAVLAKPVSKNDLIQCLGKLGFVLSSGHGASDGHITASLPDQPL